MSMLIIEVSEIRGKCPVYKAGNKIVIDGPEIVMEETDAICIHALAPLLHYAVALRDGADPRKL
ncbi:TIGR04076 family protein, partial [Methanosarcinales archaeon]